MSDKSELKIEKQTLYAFWDYDLCPYIIGGEVKVMRPNGRVVVQGYLGMLFKPIAILPDEAGLTALNQIRSLRGEYSEAESALKKAYKKEALKVIGRG
jgi:hypothetical protein